MLSPTPIGMTAALGIALLSSVALASSDSVNSDSDELRLRRVGHWVISVEEDSSEEITRSIASGSVSFLKLGGESITLLSRDAAPQNQKSIWQKALKHQASTDEIETIEEEGQPTLYGFRSENKIHFYSASGGYLQINFSRPVPREAVRLWGKRAKVVQ